MKNKKLLWCILAIAMLAGHIMFLTGNGKLAQAAEAVEITETKLSENTVYDGPVIIKNSIDLNGYVLRINGDLQIKATIFFRRGTLIVNGNVLHTDGSVEIGEGIMEVSGNYWIRDKRILADGTEDFLESSGSISMTEDAGMLKIGGDLVMQSHSWGTYYYKGILEIGGNFVKKGSSRFFSKPDHTVFFTGQKVHKVEMENENDFGSLKSDGEMEWKGYMCFDKMLSDLTVVPVSDSESSFVFAGGDVNGKHLTFTNGINFDLQEKLSLNSGVLTVEGDVLYIDGSSDLDGGTMTVHGNLLQAAGTISVNEGTMEISGDYRIQNTRVLPDGTTQRINRDKQESSGSVSMEKKGGLLKIQGDFTVQSDTNSTYYRGTLEIGGDFIQKSSNNYYYSNSEQTLSFVGEKVHRVEFESGYGRFANLKSEGKIEWKGYMCFCKMLSDLVIVPVKGDENGLVFEGGDVNGKHLTFTDDMNFNLQNQLSLNGGTLTVEGNLFYKEGSAALDNGIMMIKGNLLQTNGRISVNGGIMEISGNYQMQNTRTLPDGTIQPIDSEAIFYMSDGNDLVKIGGNFVIQSASSYYSNTAGTMEIGGDIIQKNGNSGNNFYCTGSHKVILNGKNPQKIEFESEDAKFAHLVITKPLSSYTFSRTPCWDTLEESATSISDCKIKNISKQAYIGKALKPSVTVTYQDTKLVQDTDYTLSYANNKNTGKATVTITGIGAYTGSIEKSFQIVPAKVTEVKITSSTTGQAALTWKKDATATGYVIEYSMDKSFKKNVKKITINKKATTSREITKLTANKTYYFRIRAYKTINGKKAYGAYSSAVSVNVK